ncbi:hypothetical protein E2C01_059622 [Portunus trituberculatus]|uniref:Uncharacterized protein n=1 Tax=Portunus trituberculatus TaxID=210409 RepID=A0A5B7H8A7_PORTR|nr:hypothetical protein [Portunus trituberculatus]
MVFARQPRSNGFGLSAPRLSGMEATGILRAKVEITIVLNGECSVMTAQRPLWQCIASPLGVESDAYSRTSAISLAPRRSAWGPSSRGGDWEKWRDGETEG